MEFIILTEQHREQLKSFDQNVLSQSQNDPMELQFAQWHSRSRDESLSHYLPLGWSFGLFDQDQLLGYFLAQPLLFYQGLTQTLWVETMNFLNPEIALQLANTAIRLSREKHFQRCLFSESESYDSLLKGELSKEKVFAVRTSKMI